MGYASAGLLAGLGQGLASVGKTIEDRRAAAIAAAAEEAAQARKEALSSANRQQDHQWDVQKMDTEQTNALDRIDATGQREQALATGRYAHEDKTKAEDRKFTMSLEDRKFSNDVRLARTRAALDASKSAQDIKLKHDFDAGDVETTYTTAEGKLAIVYKSGRRELTDDPGSRQYVPPNNSGLPDLPGVTPPGGVAPAPAGTDQTAAPTQPAAAASATTARKRQEALAAVGSVYANANKRDYPGLFDGAGKKIPLSDLKARIIQRYQ